MRNNRARLRQVPHLCAHNCQQKIPADEGMGTGIPIFRTHPNQVPITITLPWIPVTHWHILCDVCTLHIHIINGFPRQKL